MFRAAGQACGVPVASTWPFSSSASTVTCGTPGANGIAVSRPALHGRAQLNRPALEASPELGNEDRLTPIEQSAGKPTTRLYTDQEKAAAWMVRSLRTVLGTKHGTVHWVAEQLGCGYRADQVVDQVRRRPRRHGADVTTDEAIRVKAPARELREPRRENLILR